VREALSELIEITRFLTDTKIPRSDIVRFFDEVDRRWLGLFFRDFLSAAVLAEAFAMRAKGRT